MNGEVENEAVQFHFMEYINRILFAVYALLNKFENQPTHARMRCFSFSWYYWWVTHFIYNDMVVKFR